MIPFPGELRLSRRPGHAPTLEVRAYVGHNALYMPKLGRDGGSTCQAHTLMPVWLSPVLFCFCHIPGGLSHPPPCPQFLRLLCVIYLLILFSGSRWLELNWAECTSFPRPVTAPLNTQLTLTPGYPVFGFLRYKN